MKVALTITLDEGRYWGKLDRYGPITLKIGRIYDFWLADGSSYVGTFVGFKNDSYYIDIPSAGGEIGVRVEDVDDVRDTDNAPGMFPRRPDPGRPRRI